MSTWSFRRVPAQLYGGLPYRYYTVVEPTGFNRAGDVIHEPIVELFMPVRCSEEGCGRLLKHHTIRVMERLDTLSQSGVFYYAGTEVLEEAHSTHSENGYLCEAHYQAWLKENTK